MRHGVRGGSRCGCGGTASPPLLRAAATKYLLGIDQLVSPDFTLDVAPHPLLATAISAGGGATAATLAAADFTGH